MHAENGTGRLVGLAALADLLTPNRKGQTMAIGFVKWRGIADWLIGKVVPGSGLCGIPYRTVAVERIDGTKVRVESARLVPASHAEVSWAVWLGGCIIPLTGKPPANCL